MIFIFHRAFILLRILVTLKIEKVEKITHFRVVDSIFYSNFEAY